MAAKLQYAGGRSRKPGGNAAVGDREAGDSFDAGKVQGTSDQDSARAANWRADAGDGTQEMARRRRISRSADVAQKVRDARDSCGARRLRSVKELQRPRKVGWNIGRKFRHAV